MAQIQESPLGTFADFLWLNQPDTKYLAAGEFKAPLRLQGADAESLQSAIEKATATAFAEHMHAKAITAAEARLWSKHLPFRAELVSEGQPSGAIVFDFRQDATVPIPNSDARLPAKLALYDGAGRRCAAPVFSGSAGRLKFDMVPQVFSVRRSVGIRLTFSAVQITSFASRDPAEDTWGNV